MLLQYLAHLMTNSEREEIRAFSAVLLRRSSSELWRASEGTALDEGASEARAAAAWALPLERLPRARQRRCGRQSARERGGDSKPVDLAAIYSLRASTPAPRACCCPAMAP